MKTLKRTDLIANEKKIIPRHMPRMTQADKVSNIFYHACDGYDEGAKANYFERLSVAVYGKCPVVWAHVHLINKYDIDDIKWEEIEAHVVNIAFQLNTEVVDQPLYDWLYANNHDMIEFWNS
jgi:hypothetical protein